MIVDLQKANYSPWLWKLSDFPKQKDIGMQIQFFCRAGILAASIHNTQPWKFQIDKNTLIVFADMDYLLPAADPDGHNLLVSLGCCIANIECAANYFGYRMVTSFHTDKNNKVYAKLVFQRGSKKSLHAALCAFIPQRYSAKLAYLPQPVNELALEYLKKCSVGQTEIQIFTEKRIVSEAAKLQSEAVKRLTKHPFFSKELASWLRLNQTDKEDGMPGFVAGLKSFQALVGKTVLSHFPNAIRLLAKIDLNLINKSPAVGVIVSKAQDTKSWVEIGQTYELLNLAATHIKISIAPMHAIVQEKDIAQRLSKLIQIKPGYQPHMFFRLGYSNHNPYHTPRRSLEKFMLPHLTTEEKLAQVVGIKIKHSVTRIGRYQINFVTCGKGKPLVLLHGGNIGWGQWYPNLAALAKHFTVYALDLPGAGRSSRIDYSSLNLQKDLVDVVEEFIRQKKLISPHLVGSSIGGWICLKLALKEELKLGKIVLVDAIGFMTYMRLADRIIGLRPLAQLLSRTALRPIRSNKNIEKFLRSVFFNTTISLAPEFIEYFYETMATSHNLLFISRLSSFWGVRKDFTMFSDLTKIKNLTLVLWGEKDSLMPFAKNKENILLIPHVQVKVIKNAGHIASIEQSEQFNNEVVKFLSN